MLDRYQPFGGLNVALHGHVLTITLDNPPLNAMTAQAHADLGQIWNVAANDPEVRVIVFTGAGERAFCAGGDLNRMITNWPDRRQWLIGIEEARAMILGMLECPKPVICRINGHAMGLGASIALAGDITVMTETARIADSHVKVGLATGDGGALLWPNLIGLVEARRHLLSGEALTGADARAKGLITEAVPFAQLDEAVGRWVATLLAQSPEAVQATKQTLNLDLIEKARRYMDEMLRLETRSWESPNHPEAVRAILEKRAPNFSTDATNQN